MGVVLKVVALAMAVASIVLGYLGIASLETVIIPFLGIGLFTLTLAGFLRTEAD